MEIINNIKMYILNDDIENAYNMIIKNEKWYINNSQYWNLRGMLCFKIKEYNSAIICYKTAIDLQNDFVDGYFNLIYTLLLIGEKIKATLYTGIALRYVNDSNFINDIRNLYEGEILSQEYFNIMDEVMNNELIDKNNINLFKYIAYQFSNIDNLYIELLAEKEQANNWAYVKDKVVITRKEVIELREFINKYNENKYELIVPYNKKYKDIIKKLDNTEIKIYKILVPHKGIFELLENDNEFINSFEVDNHK
ncbi:hypothetical protein [Clostridium sp.]|uniref:hypothetical protein n=1 Tax=Clostridium sp. TaxID=1506 RepID=UPI00262B66D7|nr:hypothetical protein [Clostridium sp.]